MKGLIKFAKRLHRSEQGAEGLEKLLIVAAVVLPLLGVLIFFKGWITEWVTGEVNTVRDEAGGAMDSDPF